MIASDVAATLGERGLCVGSIEHYADGTSRITFVPAEPGPDPLHPFGRCGCGGEGRCVWCLSTCDDCGGYRHAGECPPFESLVEML